MPPLNFSFQEDASFNFTAQKLSFSLKISLVSVTKSAFSFLVTFTEEILNGKLDFLCSVSFTNLGIEMSLFFLIVSGQ